MANLSNADLQQSLTDQTARTAAAEKRVEVLTADLKSASTRADDEKDRRVQAEADVDRQTVEIRKLEASLKTYKGSTTKAGNQAQVLKRAKSPEARAIGAFKPVKSDGERSARRDALALALASGPTEVVFSDGKREIRELAPLIVDAGAWRVTPRGSLLEHEPLLEPGLTGRHELPLAGFALLNEAGDQVGWCPLPEVIVIAGGTRVQIPRGSICF